MYYIGLAVHKKTISFCVKDAAGRVHQEGKVAATRRHLDSWVRTLPQPRMIAMEATIFTGWIYDHLLPHAESVKVARVRLRLASNCCNGPGAVYQPPVSFKAVRVCRRRFRKLDECSARMR
jgi:hypothetical protein